MWQKKSSYLLVECKNWSTPVDPKELSHLREKRLKDWAQQARSRTVHGNPVRGMRESLALGSGS